MSRRVLLVGHGRIGREVFAEYEHTLDATLMVVDPVAQIPVGYEWDGRWVDIAVVMVDTPAATDRRLSGYDYRGLFSAIREYMPIAEFIVIRSTVGLDFLDTIVYRGYAARLGFSPEFYGATRHSRRSQLDLDFVIFSNSVPQWFVDLTSGGRKPLRAPPEEVIIAKLAENAYLATKVVFFHELALTCERLAVSFDVVRELVTADPRIAPGHSYCEDGLGWSSHCFDKDVPVFTELGPDTQLVYRMMQINAGLVDRREAE